MGESELVARFAAGEPGSAAEVYRAYGRLVYAVARRMLDDAGLAEEATKRTFVLAFRLAPNLPPGTVFGPWLASLAGRTATDIGRRQRPPHRALSAGAPTRPDLKKPAPSTTQLHDVWLVRQALDAMSAQDRELVRLHHDRRLTRAEISVRLAIPIGSVQSRSLLAHRRLAGLLDHLRNGNQVERREDTPEHSGNCCHR
ncbi:MAG: sigma-70 family RNA polymerase sigma factor [Nakamurella sp.]